MKFYLRYRLVSVAALATYLVVHVFAGGLHHHGAEDRPGTSVATYNTGPQFQAAGAAENEEEETCLLCSVLHLAQIAPNAFHVEAVAALNREVFSAGAVIRPYPLETATYSRGPPSI